MGRFHKKVSKGLVFLILILKFAKERCNLSIIMKQANQTVQEITGKIDRVWRPAAVLAGLEQEG